MTSEHEAQEILDRVGHTKVRRALQEVASKLDPAEDYRPLFDRAYELGFRPAWDGTVELNLPLSIGGTEGEVYAIIDIDEALNEDEALALGHIDIATYQLGKEIGAQTERQAAEEPAGPEVEPASTFFNYGWGWNESSTGFRIAWATPGTYSGYSLGLRKHGVRNGSAPQGGRVYWQRAGAGPNPYYWSNWRITNGSSSIQWTSFGFDVVGYTAQVGNGW